MGRKGSSNRRRNNRRHQELASITPDHQHLLLLMDKMVGFLHPQEYAQELKEDLQELTAKEKEYFSYYRKAGNKIVAEFSEILQDQANCKIGRKIIAGSIGKNVSLGIGSAPDFDVVLFVNDVTPPLTYIVDSFSNILKRANPNRYSNISTTKCSVQFSVKTTLELPTGNERVTIDFDVLPAVNFTQHVFHVEKQKKRALHAINQTGNPKKQWYIFSTSFSESTVSSVENLPAFDRDLIVLAKMWDNQLKQLMEEKNPGSSKISGRSALIELVATQAAHDITETNLLQGFRRFLNLMRDFDNLHIDYIPFNDNTFDKMEGPLIRDPVNPHNNYAAAVNSNNRAQFKSWAVLTRKFVNLIARSANDQNYESSFEELKDTFFDRE